MILVLGDMLFDGLPGLPPDGPVFMMEDWRLCTRIRHHQQKLVLFLSAMRHFRDRLRSQGRDVQYVELGQDGDASLYDRLRREIQSESELMTYEIADNPVRAEIVLLCQEAGARLIERPNPMFLTTPDEWGTYRSGHQSMRMADFYVYQRRRLNLLLEPNGQPLGGQWSFDASNRKRLPKNLTPPTIWSCSPDTTTQAVIELVGDHFPDHPGQASGFDWPTTHEEALDWLNQFLDERLDLFGDYEDALSSSHRTVFHSLLTPLLNTGLLTPAQVVRSTLAHHERRRVPLNSLEGFLRQIVGWREFVRGIHRHEPEEPPTSRFGHHRRLSQHWYTGDTGLDPLDLAIRRANDHAWIHHIERLMVVGAAMFMCEVHPKGAFDWFMEMTIDSADWVMGPNVYGMSQFATDRPITTKPYLSGSSYLKRMGAEGGNWEDTWDGLFWRFVHKHRPLFESNPRTRAMAGGIDRLEPNRRRRIFSVAEAFIDRVTTPG
ncbi:MAG: cryptochrome/photolyase family protein [Fimbriimonadaceae bacterium]|nr:cryptochrome/photolyase family protein [Fimbriimonadaceae bacterium]QYK58711.1 MAG: cryptochrome/photolyase family protein [Fimbriimonadaceae bacterium]